MTTNTSKLLQLIADTGNAELLEKAASLLDPQERVEKHRQQTVCVIPSLLQVLSDESLVAMVNEKWISHKFLGSGHHYSMDQWVSDCVAERRFKTLFKGVEVSCLALQKSYSQQTSPENDTSHVLRIMFKEILKALDSELNFSNRYYNDQLLDTASSQQISQDFSQFFVNLTLLVETTVRNTQNQSPLRQEIDKLTLKTQVMLALTYADESIFQAIEKNYGHEQLKPYMDSNASVNFEKILFDQHEYPVMECHHLGNNFELLSSMVKRGYISEQTQENFKLQVKNACEKDIIAWNEEPSYLLREMFSSQHDFYKNSIVKMNFYKKHMTHFLEREQLNLCFLFADKNKGYQRGLIDLETLLLSPNCHKTVDFMFELSPVIGFTNMTDSTTTLYQKDEIKFCSLALEALANSEKVKVHKKVDQFFYNDQYTQNTLQNPLSYKKFTEIQSYQTLDASQIDQEKVKQCFMNMVSGGQYFKLNPDEARAKFEAWYLSQHFKNVQLSQNHTASTTTFKI